MIDTRATKAELRALALGRRTALLDAAREDFSRRAVERLRPLIRPGETVSLFLPMRGEIDPLGLVPEIEAAGGSVALPVVEKRGMFFRRFDGESSLESGVFGTRHPAPHLPAVDPDLIVAPLAAFDRRGGRIGYGAGYYDMAIADLKARARPFRLAGIAFGCQEVEEVPAEPHDEPLPLIATECELIRVKGA
jgi:5-formyltetrahydrofolate cyclo-ligase